MNAQETWGSRIRQALGMPDVDTGPRSRELLDAEEMTYRSLYDTSPPARVNPWRAAAAAANQEAFVIPPAMSTYELAARLNERNPLSRVGVGAEPPSTSFAMRMTQPDGTVVYDGDPAAVTAMRESFRADAARQIAAAHGEAVALGPLANTVK